MLDDDAGRLLKRLDAFQRGIGVGDVVVRQLLACNFPRDRDAAFRRMRLDVKRAGLVRIFAVAQGLPALHRQVESWRKLLHAITVGARTYPVRHHAVVACSVGVGFRCQLPTQCQRSATRAERIEQAIVVSGINDDADMRMVLRRRTQHCRAADIDVLNGICFADVGLRNRRLERIEIDDQQVDRLNAVLFHHRFINAATTKQATVDAWVQGLDATAHNFRKAGDFAHVADSDTCVSQRARGAIGGKQFNIECRQTMCQFHQTGFVGNAEQGASHRHAGSISHGYSKCLQGNAPV